LKKREFFMVISKFSLNYRLRREKCKCPTERRSGCHRGFIRVIIAPLLFDWQPSEWKPLQKLMLKSRARDYGLSLVAQRTCGHWTLHRIATQHAAGSGLLNPQAIRQK
jgi:hypothetical protein